MTFSPTFPCPAHFKRLNYNHQKTAFVDVLVGEHNRVAATTSSTPSPSPQTPQENFGNEHLHTLIIHAYIPSISKVHVHVHVGT